MDTKMDKTKFKKNKKQNKMKSKKLIKIKIDSFVHLLQTS